MASISKQVKAILESIESVTKLDDLKDIESHLSERIAQMELEKRRGAFDKMKALAESAGISMKDIVAMAREERAETTGFQHPLDSSKYWSGRGRTPAWVHEYIAEHGEEKFERDCKIMPKKPADAAENQPAA